MKVKITILSWSIAALGAVVLTGCNSQPKGDPSSQTGNSPTLVEQQIANLYQSIFNELPQGGLRAASNEKVGNGETYITNFASGGFMLYNVDSLGGVILLGLSDNGALSSKDTTNNPILKGIITQAMYAKGITDGAQKDWGVGTSDPDHPIDPKPFEPIPTPDWVYPHYETRIMNLHTETPMKPRTLDFGQREPFNSYLHKAGENGHDALGCANTALAVLFSHYELPKQIFHKNKIVPIEWKKLRELNEEARPYSRDKEWRHLLLKYPNLSYQMTLVGTYLYYNTGRIWSDGGGTAVTNRQVRKFLERHRFNPKVIDYDIEQLCKYMEEYKRPILAFGKGDSRMNNWHYWVFDGYFKQQYDRIAFRQDYEGGPWMEDHIVTKNVKHFYVHCNWGWDGDCNGYFSPRVLKPFDPYRKNPKPEDSPESMELRSKLPDEKLDYTYGGKLYLTYPTDLAGYWIVE